MCNNGIEAYKKILLVGGGLLGQKFYNQIDGIEEKLIGVIDMLSDEERKVKEVCGHSIQSADSYRSAIESEDVAIAWAIGAWQTIPALLEEFIERYAITDLSRIYVANPYTALRYFCVDDELGRDKRIPFCDEKYNWVERLFDDDISKGLYKRLIGSKPFDTLEDPVEIISYADIREDYYMSEDYWHTYDFSKIKKCSKEATVIDGGAFIGDSVMPICNSLKEEDIYYYAFEPFPDNIAAIKRNKELQSVCKKLITYEYGISDKDETLLFQLPSNGDAEGGKFISDGSCVGKEGTLEVRALDNLNLEIKGNLYIKMDIEGSELKALVGAKQMIQKYKPHLAICLYHRKNDLVEIPLYLKQLVPEYKFYLRGGFHTILWAMNEGK